MGKIYIVGIGPGSLEDITYRAKDILDKSDVIIGYKLYLDLLRDFIEGKVFIDSVMTQEVERCKLVIQKALEGNTVALVSGGDSGIYGMAGLMISMLNSYDEKIEFEIVPGITALSSASSILGAPLMHDFAVISLSDLLTDWSIIEKRLEMAAAGDFVISLYNPKSKKRTKNIEMARDIILRHRGINTPVGIVRNAGRKNESYNITSLGAILEHHIDMFTIIIIGNSATYIEDGKIITPRGYSI